MEQVHKMWETLMELGATKDDCIEIIKIAYATVDKMVNEKEGK